ncbi:Putative uncharacterized transposon-derived protein F52C9.6, partial [Harpegnathos saltator]
AYYANIPIIKSSLITRRTKVKVYKTLIRPIVTYGAETWTLTNKDMEILRRFERKIIRRIYGAVKEGERWRIRHNEEINNILEGEDIVRFIKSRRISWMGHIQRMGTERMPKEVYKGKIYGTAKRGRPRKRWIQDVLEDLKRMKIGGWWEKAERREEWKQIVKAA